MSRKINDKFNVIFCHFKKMGFWNASSYIFQRIFKGRKLLCVGIKNTNLRIFLRNDIYDTQVFTQLFIRGELNIFLQETPEVIIDGGANIGLATLYFKHKYPNATIIAIEPEPGNFNLLVKNTKNYPGIFCLQKGIWNKKCSLQIIDNGDGNVSFITKELAGNEDQENAIGAITINDIMQQFQLDRLGLVKLDIEGSEKKIFESNYEQWLSKTRDMIIEIHPHLQPDCETTVLTALEKDFTYRPAGEYYHFSRKVRASIQ